MRKQDFKRVSEYVWEIPKDHRDDMTVPARMYASEKLLEAVLGEDDQSVEQLVNTATLPGLERYALAMPDIHQGYGFPIGGVIASRTKDGIISPGGVGYDINCGVRVLASSMTYEEIRAASARSGGDAVPQLPQRRGAGREHRPEAEGF